MSVLYKIATSEICEIETSKIQENMQEFLNWREGGDVCQPFITSQNAVLKQFNSIPFTYILNKKMLIVLYI